MSAILDLSGSQFSYFPVCVVSCRTKLKNFKTNDNVRPRYLRLSKFFRGFFCGEGGSYRRRCSPRGANISAPNFGR